MARREHSLAELDQKLRLRHFDSLSIESVLERLREQGLQSDARFCEIFTRQRVASGYGPLRLRLELQQKGVSAELVAEALRPYEDEWPEALSTLLEKRLLSCSEVLSPRELAKQQRYLMGRGFSAAHVRRALKLWNERHTP